MVSQRLLADLIAATPVPAGTLLRSGTARGDLQDLPGTGVAAWAGAPPTRCLTVAFPPGSAIVKTTECSRLCVDAAMITKWYVFFGLLQGVDMSSFSLK